MSVADLISTVAHSMTLVANHEVKLLGEVLLMPGSPLSLPAVACALTLATAVVALRRRPGRRWPRWRVWLRALFPRRLFHSASTRADFGFFLLNTVGAAGGLAAAILATSQVAGWVRRGLTHALGASPEVALPGPATAVRASWTRG